MARHITQLKINGYRGLRDFEVNDLSDINVLIGDNNCGKTSVLEVLNTFSSISNMSTWLNNNAKRKSFMENLNPCIDLEYLFDINNSSQPIEIIFSDTDNNTNIINLTSNTEEKILSLKDIQEIDRFAYKRLYSNIKYKQNNDMSQQDIDNVVIQVLHSTASISLNKKNIGTTDFFEFSTVIPKEKDDICIFKTAYEYPSKYIQEDFSLSDIIENPEMYNNLIKVLQEFDEDITQIFADKEGSKVIYKIASNNNAKSLPISMFGDGLKLAISIFAAIPRAKDGLLLIDEFDSSLHTSQIGKVLSAIISMCKKLNIQLFLSTHSIEAIDTVLDCCIDSLDDVRVITLNKKPSKTFSRLIDGKLAKELRTKNDAELR